MLLEIIGLLSPFRYPYPIYSALPAKYESLLFGPIPCACVTTLYEASMFTRGIPFNTFVVDLIAKTPTVLGPHQYIKYGLKIADINIKLMVESSRAQFKLVKK